MDQYVAANAVLSLFAKNYMELKKGLPIRPSEMGLLNIITETEGPHTPVVLARLLGVSKPMITAHLTSLMNKGYISKHASRDDKRAYTIEATDKALILVKNVKADMNRQLKYIKDGMGQERFALFVQLAEEANCLLSDRSRRVQYGSQR